MPASSGSVPPDKGRRAKFKQTPKKVFIDAAIKQQIKTKDLTNNKQDTEENLIDLDMSNTEKVRLAYDLYDKGPFFVHVEGEKPVHPIKIADLLRKKNIRGITDVKKINKNCVKISTIDAKSANKIIDSRFDEDISAYIPQFYISSTGIIRGVPIDTDLTDVTNYINYERQRGGIRINKMERMKYWNVESQTSEPSRNVKVEFRGQKLPEELDIYHTKVKVGFFERRPLQCINCMKYGHISKRCKAEKICSNCLGGDHQRNVCVNNSKCFYCEDGNHSTVSKQCPERKRQQTITNLMDQHKISYGEAKLKLINDNNDEFPRINANFIKNRDQQSGTFAEVLKLRNEMDEMKILLQAKDHQIEKLIKQLEILTQNQNQMQPTQYPTALDDEQTVHVAQIEHHAEPSSTQKIPHTSNPKLEPQLATQLITQHESQRLSNLTTLVECQQPSQQQHTIKQNRKLQMQNRLIFTDQSQKQDLQQQKLTQLQTQPQRKTTQKIEQEQQITKMENHENQNKNTNKNKKSKQIENKRKKTQDGDMEVEMAETAEDQTDAFMGFNENPREDIII